jgi:hypothetical protein
LRCAALRRAQFVFDRLQFRLHTALETRQERFPAREHFSPAADLLGQSVEQALRRAELTFRLDDAHQCRSCRRVQAIVEQRRLTRRSQFSRSLRHPACAEKQGIVRD